ncbi:hypothetical protein BUALT_Bualt14G0035800 [Buddleja alternifolia]|uniref:Cytochrome P450 n=1 Tax=Buddleja alternifolia TaxID=168488 RepID=A0AAV6WGM0_9LAMI|nr:hypothetical protein BUALT_Bualt14G0035800 [Buddleja alternifolia]
MAMLLIPFMALLITIVVVILAKHKSLRHLLHHPPGPRRLPFIGNLHQLQYGSSLHLCLSQLSNKYGPLMYMKLIHIPVIVISSAKVAKLALKHNDLAFSSRPSSIASAKLSYNNLDILSSSYTSYWREMRKIVFVHLFTHKQVRSFRPVRDDVVSHMINEISKRANLNQAINLSHIISSFSSSLIFRVAFGKRCDDETRFDEIINELQKMITGIFVGDHFPSFSWIDKLTGMTDRLEKVFKDSDSFYQQLIDEHLSPNRPDSMNGDLVDILIQLRDQHASVDWDHIKAILMWIGWGRKGGAGPRRFGLSDSGIRLARVVWEFHFPQFSPGKYEEGGVRVGLRRQISGLGRDGVEEGERRRCGCGLGRGREFEWGLLGWGCSSSSPIGEGDE